MERPLRRNTQTDVVFPAPLMAEADFKTRYQTCPHSSGTMTVYKNGASGSATLASGAGPGYWRHSDNGRYVYTIPSGHVDTAGRFNLARDVTGYQPIWIDGVVYPEAEYDDMFVVGKGASGNAVDGLTGYGAAKTSDVTAARDIVSGGMNQQVATLPSTTSASGWAAAIAAQIYANAGVLATLPTGNPLTSAQAQAAAAAALAAYGTYSGNPAAAIAALPTAAQILAISGAVEQTRGFVQRELLRTDPESMVARILAVIGYVDAPVSSREPSGRAMLTSGDVVSSMLAAGYSSERAAKLDDLDAIADLPTTQELASAIAALAHVEAAPDVSDLATAASIVDLAAVVALLLKYRKNARDRTDSDDTVFDDDGVTPILHQAISDADGVASRTKNDV